MGQPKLPEGLCWRKRPDGSYHKDIYFAKTHRGYRLRESTGTDDVAEAERRLRERLNAIDQIEVYGLRPAWTFKQALVKFYTDHADSAVQYAPHLDSMIPFVGDMPLKSICLDTLRPWIEHRKSQGIRKADGVSARTINFGIQGVTRLLRLATFYWRHNGQSWLDTAPIIPMEKGPKLDPYPLSWDQQDRLFARLPERHRDMCLFKVNTGCREEKVKYLRWEWEKDLGIGETVFVVPKAKNGKPHYVVLNSIARMIVEKYRGKHEHFVFGKPMSDMSNPTWQRAWKAEIGVHKKDGYRCGVHNLKHTFGKRLRDAGVGERDVEDLLHHMPKTITRHYSQPELRKLRECVERVVRKPQLRAVS